jgi:hypothetical protein
MIHSRKAASSGKGPNAYIFKSGSVEQWPHMLTADGQGGFLSFYDPAAQRSANDAFGRTSMAERAALALPFTWSRFVQQSRFCQVAAGEEPGQPLCCSNN